MLVLGKKEVLKNCGVGVSADLTVSQRQKIKSLRDEGIRGFFKGGRLYKEPLQPQSIPRTPHQSQDSSSSNPRSSGSNRPTLSAQPPVVPGPGPRSYRYATETLPQTSDQRQTSDTAQSHSSVPGTQPKSGQRQTANPRRNQGRGYGRERDPTRKDLGLTPIGTNNKDSQCVADSVGSCRSES
ncbi:hypothetical protein ElyMa_003477700 [Elysia marginata]|uniref:LEM domain-containing protein n=1 Tax=Elysia marginata TaxID=1093978 RepID=A0AAV4EBS8_9GAST|nr:hypothetical protein ElyMa_003477700 [Elysia marginata]